MFGLFDGDLRHVRKLRLEYEDVRQRVLYKMNPYQQYSFLSAYQNMIDELQETIDSTSEDDLKRWREIGDEVKQLAQRTWQVARRTPGIGGEGAVAGVNGLALLAIRFSAKGYRLAEAMTLATDIYAFEAQIEMLVGEQQGNSL
jgi:hypothetical protein